VAGLSGPLLPQGTLRGHGRSVWLFDPRAGEARRARPPCDRGRHSRRRPAQPRAEPARWGSSRRRPHRCQGGSLRPLVRAARTPSPTAPTTMTPPDSARLSVQTVASRLRLRHQREGLSRDSPSREPDLPQGAKATPHQPSSQRKTPRQVHDLRTPCALSLDPSPGSSCRCSAGLSRGRASRET
jgi:hypothetical protein